MRFLLLPLILTLLSTHAEGQKVLQIEKYGSPKTRKLFIGDEITFQVQGAEQYQ